MVTYEELHGEAASADDCSHCGGGDIHVPAPIKITIWDAETDYARTEYMCNDCLIEFLEWL